MKTATARSESATTCVTLKVAGTECLLRATTVWPIHEVLEVEAEMLLAAGGHEAAEGELLLDLLDSRMIAPPRPRRRRERPVSSRAVFYAGGDD